MKWQAHHATSSLAGAGKQTSLMCGSSRVTRVTSISLGASISSVCLSCLKLRNVCTRPTRGGNPPQAATTTPPYSLRRFRLRFHRRRRRCKPIYLVAHQTVKSYTHVSRGAGCGCQAGRLFLAVELVTCRCSTNYPNATPNGR